MLRIGNGKLQYFIRKVRNDNADHKPVQTLTFGHKKAYFTVMVSDCIHVYKKQLK